MVLFWFLLAFVLLVAAIVLLRLDSKNRRSAQAGPSRPSAAGRERTTTGRGTPQARNTGQSPPEQPIPQPQGGPSPTDSISVGQEPIPAPFQRGSAAGASKAGTPPMGTASPSTTDTDPSSLTALSFEIPQQKLQSVPPTQPDPGHATRAQRGAADAVELTDDPRGAEEPPVGESGGSRGLSRRLRGLIPGRRPKAGDEAPLADTDTAVDSARVVNWLESRQFEPSAEAAPEWVRGDFASGLAPLGAVSYGLFRGRSMLVGFSDECTVLALERAVPHTVVVEIARADVPTDPGVRRVARIGDWRVSVDANAPDSVFPGAIDRKRLDDAISELPSTVRRVWGEQAWSVASVDGRDDVDNWDVAVAAMDQLAEVLAVLPPAGGSAPTIPAETDPGAPGAYAGPLADVAKGMDSRSLDPVPIPPVEDLLERLQSAASVIPYSVSVDPTPASGQSIPGGPSGLATLHPVGDPPTPQSPPATTSGAAGHLQVVPERNDAVRNLTDNPVVRDSGDRPVPEDSGRATSADKPGETEKPVGPGPLDPSSSDSAQPGHDQPSGAPTPDDSDTGMANDALSAHRTLESDTEHNTTEHDTTEDGANSAAAPVAPAADEHTPEPEVDPFDAVMNPPAVPESRGDVAADFLPAQAPLPRPSRGIGQSFGAAADTAPALGTSEDGGEPDIKPLGVPSDAPVDDISSEYDRFEAARLDSAAPDTSGGRHRQPPRQDAHANSPLQSHSSEGMDPDLVETTRIEMPRQLRRPTWLESRPDGNNSAPPRADHHSSDHGGDEEEQTSDDDGLDGPRPIA